MSISCSFRLISSKLPLFLKPKTYFPQTLILSIPISHTNLLFFRPISIQRIPTKPQSSSSSIPSSSSSPPLQPIEELPPNLQEIIKLFQSVQDSEAKYKQLLFYGKKLIPLDNQFKTNENKVQGCVSQVWVRAYIDSHDDVVFEADSDSVLTKGLAALLVEGLSGSPVEDILRISPDFVVLLGLQQSLTPSRNNGFLNMLNLMKKKALQVHIDAQQQQQVSKLVESEELLVQGLDSISQINGVGNSEHELSSENSQLGTSQTSDSDVLGSRGERIKERLERELSPIELEIEDVSYQHAGHAGVRGTEGETHFNVKVVSSQFEGKSLVKRHRLIYALLDEELQNGLHALSIVAKTPSEVLETLSFVSCFIASLNEIYVGVNFLYELAYMLKAKASDGLIKNYNDDSSMGYEMRKYGVKFWTVQLPPKFKHFARRTFKIFFCSRQESEELGVLADISSAKRRN